MKNGLVLSVKPEDVEIIEENGIMTITIKNDMSMVVEMTKDMMLKTQGDFHILSEGEMSFASKNNVHIDSVGSNLYLNSRRSNILKDEPESIAYRAGQELEHNKTQLDAIHQHEFTLALKDRVTKLEKQVKELINAGCSKKK